MPIPTESLDGFEKAVDDAVVGIELPADDVAVLHGEAEDALCVVRFLVHNLRTQEGLFFVLWIDPRYHAVA